MICKPNTDVRAKLDAILVDFRYPFPKRFIFGKITFRFPIMDDLPPLQLYMINTANHVELQFMSGKECGTFILSPLVVDGEIVQYDINVIHERKLLYHLFEQRIRDIDTGDD